MANRFPAVWRAACAGTILSLAAIAAPASAAIVNLEIGTAPPPARVEVVPGPRRGYEWAPGYWSWNGRRHVWVAGHWLRERRGYAYVPEHWEQRGDRWHFERGHYDHR